MKKTPFNWVGNKYKYINIINSIVKDKQYEYVLDMFMGSGNIILNIDVMADTYVGNDKNKLLPKIYKFLNEINYKYTYYDIENILNKFNRFSNKEDYYIFRDYWNEKYLNNVFDKDFIIETILLLKMCSNSMVRFNPKEGYFNQGFRGLGKKKEFFTENMKQLCLDELNKLIDNIKNKNYEFLNADFMDYFDGLCGDKKGLLILDPPYILRKDMYDTDWTEKHDDKLYELMRTTKDDYIYFNYLERDGVVNKDLESFINENKLTVIDINNKTMSGQGRDTNVKEVREVVITNVL